MKLKMALTVVLALLTVQPLASLAWVERWDSAQEATYIPTCDENTPMFKGDGGVWDVGDTASCDYTPSPETIQIVSMNGNKVLKLTSVPVEVAGNVWADIQWAKTNPPTPLSIPLKPGVQISFFEQGELAAPTAPGSNCGLRPCGDKIYLILRDNSFLTNFVAYVLQHAPDDSPSDCPWCTAGYKEIFLDSSDGNYQRDLYADFASINGPAAVGTRITAILFEVDENGWAILDNLAIGSGSGSGDGGQSPVHDLAVTAIKVPKKITLSARAPSFEKLVTVQIQNRGNQTETIPEVNTLTDLVTLTVESLGTCPNPVPALVMPRTLPITLKPKAKLTVAYQVTFNCANDPLASTKTENHADYRYVATVHPEVLGLEDADPADSVCPHNAPAGGVDPVNAAIKDNGCGCKKSDGTLGADVVTDVILK